LKKTNKIQFKAFLLLLLYLFSNFPSSLFHDHALELSPYEKATSCEKTIYYSHKEGSCNHKTHIGLAAEKCHLCDNHTLSPHTLFTFFSSSFNKEFSQANTEVSERYFYQAPAILSNRGPPSVLSFTV
jgi:hypothetical protein